MKRFRNIVLSTAMATAMVVAATGCGANANRGHVERSAPMGITNSINRLYDTNDTITSQNRANQTNRHVFNGNRITNTANRTPAIRSSDYNRIGQDTNVLNRSDRMTGVNTMNANRYNAVDRTANTLNQFNDNTTMFTNDIANPANTMMRGRVGINPDTTLNGTTGYNSTLNGTAGYNSTLNGTAGYNSTLNGTTAGNTVNNTTTANPMGNTAAVAGALSA